MTDLAMELLAQAPTSAMYIHPIKLAAVALGFAFWAWLCAWVDKDAVAVNTYRLAWNFVMLAAGVVSAVLALFVPLFALGFPLQVVVLLGAAVAYVVHRNALVREEDRVLTPTHFKRLQEQGFSGKKKLKEVKEKVRITGHDKKVVAVPDDPDAREHYRVAQDLLFDSVFMRATSVELAPNRDAVKVTYEVDGQSIDRDALARESAEGVVALLKRAAGLSLEERRKPQQGFIVLGVADQKRRTLVRTDGSTVGEKLSYRVFGREIEFKTPDLGFTPRQLELVTSLREITPGLVLLSAPPKAGLTTTVYSFVRTHDRFLQNVQMLEFDREIDIDNVTQKLYAPAEGKTFAEQLLRIVRSDPDILVLPEIRDRESAAVAAQAATQKQKVYVGVQAADVFEALRKWVTLVGDRNMVAKGLLAIGNQRLIRLLCNECKQAYKPDAEMLRKLNLPSDKVLYRPPDAQYDKNGKPIICQACGGSGYSGRTAVFDWLMVDDGVREVLRRSQSLDDVKQYLVKKGAIGIQSHALQKVLDGATSIQEVSRALRSSEAKATTAVGGR